MAIPRGELRPFGLTVQPRFSIGVSGTAADGWAENEFQILFGSSGVNTCELPVAADWPGRMVAAKRINDGLGFGGSVTVNRQGADTVEGGTSFLISDLSDYWFQSDGVSAWWLVVGQNVASAPSVSLGGIVPATAVPTWYKINFAHTDFQIAALTRTITLCQLPGGGILHGSKLKHSLAFLGGALASYTLKIGDNTVLDKYLSAFNVFAAAANSNFGLAQNWDSFDQSANQIISIAATATGANLSASTQGAGSAWVKVSKAV